MTATPDFERFPPIPDDESIVGVIDPTGYRLLVRLPKLGPKFKRDFKVEMTEERRALEEKAQSIVQVLAMGPDAYVDQTKFPSGPWCGVGDYVLIRPYAGTSFQVGASEYRLINDDTVQGVVRGDHTMIERV